ncbi:hypothetical protein GCM10010176_038190 [Nonomuraea spiralis]|nr:hypothetical protein GCM10010176_038190 [Nonomuraea spiralis]
MHDQGGFAVGVAARLPVDEVAVADVEQAMIIGFDRGIHPATVLASPTARTGPVRRGHGRAEGNRIALSR